jgi:DNA-binding NarL/FixJ family response regulator
VIAEDTVLLREGLAGLLEDAGHTVLARVGDAESLLAVVAEHDPELAIVDVRMPPTFEDEGMLAAVEIRRLHPATAVLVLSQHVESRHAVDLVGSGGGFGYLLKDRVLHLEDFDDALRRVAGGGVALDPEVVQALVRSRQGPALQGLTERETEVLSLVAQGHTNTAIGALLRMSERTVETHMRSIFNKLGLLDDGATHRRVRAVVTYLESGPNADHR